MTATLTAQEFLASRKPRPYRRGEWCCMALVMQWHEHLTGRQAETPLNKPGIGGMEIIRMSKAAGGPLRLANVALRTNGWRPREGAGEDGDIIVGLYPSSFLGAFVGIRVGGWAASVDESGGIHCVRLADIGNPIAWKLEQL